MMKEESLEDSGTNISGFDEKNRETDEQFLRRGRLEALGIMAGGIAHDFNNILTSIIGYISVARLKMEGHEDCLSLMSEAETAVLRARDLTKQLLSFSRDGDPVRETAPVNEILTETTRFILYGSSVKAEYYLAGELWDVDIDKTQLSQVIGNIVLNAVQAMGHGGVLTIRGENVEIAAGERTDIPGGRYIRIEIADNGPGIPEINLVRIFEPYFTTREGGSGLGLAICSFILSMHKGHISVESGEDRGTRFIIHLPAVTEKHPRPLDNGQLPLMALRGRVLVMDDDAGVGKITCRMLEGLGFEAVMAVSGNEVLEKFIAACECERKYDIVMLDLTGPGREGALNISRRVRELCSTVKLVVTSGYADSSVLERYRDYGFDGRIAKPYSMQDLMRGMSCVIGCEDESPDQEPSQEG